MGKKLYITAFLALAGLYLLLTVTLPSDPQVLKLYKITQSRQHILSLGIAIPIVAIWLAALYGSVKVSEYAKTIQDTPEGQSFHYLARGLMVLVSSLPFLSVLSVLFTYTGYKQPDLLPAITILRNYINLSLPLAAFLLIAKGAENLLKTLRTRRLSYSPRFALIGVIALTSLYTWLITTRPIGPTGDTSYYLPNVMIIFTLAVPYVWVWYKGTLAAYQLYIYKRHVKGSIYKQALGSLAMGMGTIIFLSVIIQMIITLTARLRSLNLSPLLSLIYLLVGLTAIGYGLIARGAKKLKRIEDV